MHATYWVDDVGVCPALPYYHSHRTVAPCSALLLLSRCCRRRRRRRLFVDDVLITFMIAL